MCGIGGIINLTKNAKKLNFKDISTIKNHLKRRGPDADGLWISKNKDAMLTIQRLATQDSRKLANQPCFSFDKKIIIVMNGEIYNHKKIRKFLERKGYNFISNNDAEVAVNAYRYWGKSFLKKIEGQFSLCVIDTEKNVGIIFRDEHGICPLYYTLNNNRLIFSSTPTSIFKQLNQKLKISKKGFADFIISGCMTENNTFYDNIKYLSPGHYFEFIISKKLSNPIKLIENLLVNNNQLKRSVINTNQKIYEILKNNVSERLRGSKNVGIFLSGGIDSILLLAIYKKLFPKKNIETFTAAFCDEKNKTLVGEHNQVKRICKYFKCNHNLIKIYPKDLVHSIEKSDYPTTGFLEFCFEKLASRAKKKKIDVVLSGEGADEIFFGYDHNLALIGIFNKEFKFLKKKYSLRHNYNKGKKFSELKIEDLFLLGGADINLENNRNKVFTKKLQKVRSFRSSIKSTIRKLKMKNPQDVDSIIINLDYLIKIPELQIRRAEEPSMGKGVEMRFPYLSVQLKNYVNSLSLKDKIDKNLNDKILLRKVAKKLVPKRLQTEKLPFGVPAVRKQYFSNATVKFNKPALSNIFFKNYFKLSKIILNGHYTKLKLLEKPFLKSILSKQKSYDEAFYDPILWRVWSFACWYEKNFKNINKKKTY